MLRLFVNRHGQNEDNADGILNGHQTLPIVSEEVKRFIEQKVSGVSPDKRFAYYLMASTGICVVPLSGFNSNLHGFRVTLLEGDEVKFRTTMQTIADKIGEYIKTI